MKERVVTDMKDLFETCFQKLDKHLQAQYDTHLMNQLLAPSFDDDEDHIIQSLKVISKTDSLLFAVKRHFVNND